MGANWSSTSLETPKFLLQMFKQKKTTPRCAWAVFHRPSSGYQCLWCLPFIVQEKKRMKLKKIRGPFGAELWCSKAMSCYCWWKTSCTSWQVIYPTIYMVLYISGGAGFLRSTVCISIYPFIVYIIYIYIPKCSYISRWMWQFLTKCR